MLHFARSRRLPGRVSVPARSPLRAWGKRATHTHAKVPPAYAEEPAAESRWHCEFGKSRDLCRSGSCAPCALSQAAFGFGTALPTDDQVRPFAAELSFETKSRPDDAPASCRLTTAARIDPVFSRRLPPARPEKTKKGKVRHPAPHLQQGYHAAHLDATPPIWLAMGECLNSSVREE